MPPTPAVLLEHARSYLATEAELARQPIGLERLTAQQVAFGWLKARVETMPVADARAMAALLQAWTQAQADAASGTPAGAEFARAVDDAENLTGALNRAAAALAETREAA